MSMKSILAFEGQKVKNHYLTKEWTMLMLDFLCIAIVQWVLSVFVDVEFIIF